MSSNKKPSLTERRKGLQPINTHIPSKDFNAPLSARTPLSARGNGPSWPSGVRSQAGSASPRPSHASRTLSVDEFGPPPPSPSPEPRTPGGRRRTDSLSADGRLSLGVRKAAKEAVAVEIRVRPCMAGGEVGPMTIGSSSIAVTDDYIEKQYSFDSVHGIDATQKSIYARSAMPVVSKVVEGFDGTILAYGQTGSGKTHTMMGDLDNEEKHGIIPQSIHTIFAGADQSPPGLTTTSYTVTISFFEIYNENVFDLLGEDSSRDVQKKVSLTVREDKINGFTVVDLSRFVVRDKAEFLRLVEMGNKNRAVQGTVQNSVSSRSHSFLTVDIERELVLAGALDITPTRMWSRLNLVDLAGSERFKHYTADDLGTSLSKETLSINQSLSCLSNVINALTSNDKVIPYRDSKLTRLLKHSLGGNSKTLFIACVNPSGDNMKESLATLRYATRAKQIKNKPTRNTDPADALSFKLQEMGVELAELRPLKSSYGELRKVVDELVKATDEFPFLRDEKKTTNDDLFEETKSVPKDVVLRDADTLRRLGEVWSSSGTRHKQNLIEAKGEIERIKRRMEEAAALEETDALRLSEVAEVRKELEALQQEKVKEAQLSTERLRKLQLAKETLEVDKESLLRRLADGDESSRTEIKSDRQERAALKLERQVEKEELQALRAQLQKHQQSVSEKDQELRTLEQRCMQELKTAQVDLIKAHSEVAKYQQTLLEHEKISLVEMQMFKDKAVAEGDQRRETDLAKERDLRLTEREAAVKDQFARERVILEERETLIADLETQIKEARASKTRLIRETSREFGRLKLEHDAQWRPPPPADAAEEACSKPSCVVM